MGLREYRYLDILISKMKERTNIDNYQYNIGAIALDKHGTVLSVGFNSYTKTHPLQMLYNKENNPSRLFLHAEIDALVKSKVEPYMLIVCRLSKLGKIRIAKPCSGCYQAIRDYKVKKVFFTNNYKELVLLDTDVDLDTYRITCNHYKENI